MSKARDIADLDFNAPDIDGGNIDGATIGGTTAAAGSFSGFTVEGSSTGTLNNVNFRNTDSSINQTAMRIGVGVTNSAGAAYTFIEAKENGVDGYPSLDFYTGINPTKALSIDVSQNVTIPSGNLDVTGILSADEIKVGATDRIYLDGGSNTYIQESASDDLRFFVGGAQALRVRGSGTDILGAITASGKLTSSADVGLNTEYAVLGDDTQNRQLKFSQYQTGGSNNNAGHRINAASGFGELALSVGGTDGLKINASQNVSIPAGSLTVASNTSVTGRGLVIEAEIGTITDSRVKIMSQSSGQGELSFRTGGTASGNEGLHISQTQNVSVPNGSLTVGGSNISSPQEGTIQMATVESASGDLWTSINTGDNSYSSMPSELSIMNTADNTTNSFAGVFFQAGETSAGTAINAARIGAIRTGAFNTDLAFATRGTGGMLERFRITSTGGITHTSVAGGHVRFNSGVIDSDFTVSSDGYSHMLHVDGGTNRFGLGSSSVDNFAHFKKTTLVGRPASNGNTILTLEHATDTGIQFFSATQTQLRFGDASDTGSGAIIYTHSDNTLRLSANGSHRFTIGGTTALSIDSSQNVSIPNGNLTIGPNGEGRIDVINTNNIRIGGTAASHAGIQFGTNTLIPESGGSVSNGDLDLGFATGRFKDAYLSGGVFLGGTGAANKLDDYEEGSWTPALTASGGTSGTAYTTQAGRYTKVGDKVTANFHILLSNEGTLTGTTRISGLPFSGVSSPIYQTATLMVGNNALDKDQKLSGMQYAVNAFIYLMIEESDVALSQASGNGAFKNNTEISGSVTYFTNS